MFLKNSFSYIFVLTLLVFNSIHSMFTVKTNPYYQAIKKRKQVLQARVLQSDIETKKQILQKQDNPPEKKIIEKPSIITKDPLPLEQLKGIVSNFDNDALYITGLEDIKSNDDIVTVPLSIITELPELNIRIEHYKKQYTGPVTIPFPFSIRTIKLFFRCMIYIRSFYKIEIRRLLTQISLTDILQLLAFSQYLAADAISENYFEPYLYIKLAQASLKEIKEINFSEFFGKTVEESIFSNVTEILKLLIIKTHAQKRKIVLKGHSGSVNKVLCNDNATRIISQGTSISSSGFSYPDIFILDTALEFIEKIPKEYPFSNSFINLFDMSKDGKKIIVYSNKGLLLYTIPSTLDTLKIESIDTRNINPESYVSAKFDPTSTQIVAHSKSIPLKNRIYHTPLNPINFSQIELPDDVKHDILFNADFINNNTIVTCFFCTDLKMLYLYFFDVINKKWRYEFFTIEELKDCIVNKKKEIIVFHSHNEIIFADDKGEKNRYEAKKDDRVIKIKFSASDECLLSICQNEKSKNYILTAINIDQNELYPFAVNIPHPDLHPDMHRDSLIYAEGNSIIFKKVNLTTSNSIKKYTNFEINLSGISGAITSLQFSPDGKKIIASSDAKKNNIIVWQLITPEEEQALQKVGLLDVSILKLLLPLTTASINKETTLIEESDLELIKNNVPNSITDLLLVTTQETKPTTIDVPFKKPFYSRLPEKFATE